MEWGSLVYTKGRLEFTRRRFLLFPDEEFPIHPVGLLGKRWASGGQLGVLESLSLEGRNPNSELGFRKVARIVMGRLEMRSPETGRGCRFTGELHRQCCLWRGSGDREKGPENRELKHVTHRIW